MFLIVRMLVCHLIVSILQIFSDESIETAKQLALREGLLVCSVCLLSKLFLQLILFDCSCTWTLGVVDLNDKIRSHVHTKFLSWTVEEKENAILLLQVSILCCIFVNLPPVNSVCIHLQPHLDFPIYLRKVNGNVYTAGTYVQ